MKKILFICFFSICFLATSIFIHAGELDKRWIYFASNMANCNFYYDTETVLKSKNGIVRVWKKMICPKSKQIPKDYEYTSLNEIDCVGRVYRSLEAMGRTYDNTPSAWSGVIPESYDEALFNIVCKKKKER